MLPTFAKRTLKLLVCIFLIIVFFGTENLFAQGRHLIRNQGFFYTTEGWYGISDKLSSNYIINTDAFKPRSYGFKASANWFLSYHLSAGGAVGVLNYENPGSFTFPLLVNSQAYLSKGSNTPLVFAEGGYGLRFDHHQQDKGLLYEVGIGYRYRIKWKNFFVIKAGYHGFKNDEWVWERKLDLPVDPTDPYQWYYLKRQSFNITIAFYYSTRY